MFSMIVWAMYTAKLFIYQSKLIRVFWQNKWFMKRKMKHCHPVSNMILRLPFAAIMHMSYCLTWANWAYFHEWQSLLLSETELFTKPHWNYLREDTGCRCNSAINHTVEYGQQSVKRKRLRSQQMVTSLQQKDKNQRKKDRWH